MANVTVSVPTSNITVDTTNSIVNVASTTSNVLVGETVVISNSDVRGAISVSNVSGFGNLAYDNSTGSNGIIQYTGVSTSDIRGQLSATAPMIYNSTTGDISIDSSALFSGKTTDDLAEGTTNLYFTTARANSAVVALLDNPGTTANINADGRLIVGQLYAPSTSIGPVHVSRPYGNTYPNVPAKVFTLSPDDATSTPVGIGWDEQSERLYQFYGNGLNYRVLPTDTDELLEGSTNLYFSDARARQAISVTDTGGFGSLLYNNSTGVITYTGPSASDIRTQISVTDAGGDGSLTYDNSTGVLTYTGPSAAETRAHFSGGDGINLSSGVISVDGTVVRTTGAANISGLKTFYNDGIEVEGVNSGDLAKAEFVNSTVSITGGGSFTSNVSSNFNLHDINIYRGNINQELGSGGSSNPYRTNVFNDHGIKYYGNINLESRVTTPGSESNTYVQTDMTRSRTVKTNYLFMGSNAAVGSNVLYSTTSPAAAIAPEAVSTTAGTPLFEVFTANASVWADPDTSQSLDSGSANRRITKVGELVDTNNPQTIGGAKTFTTDLVVQGNVDVSGNLNYVEVQDLLVRENTITMNYGNSSVNTTSQVIVDRTAYPGGGASNAALIWQENLDKWQLNDGTNTSDIVTSLNIGSHAVTTVNGASGPGVILDTNDVSEGSQNKYFTTSGAAVNTDNLTEGSTNLYYTDARFNSAFSGKTTDNLTEGSTNEYYTDARSRAALSVTQNSASGTGTLSYNDNTGVFSYTPPVLPTAGIQLTDLSTTTASASSGGSLAYDNTSGVFTFAPADVSNFITLSSLSASNNATPSGSGSITYDNGTGSFTYTPPVLPVGTISQINPDNNGITVTNGSGPTTAIGLDTGSSTFVDGVESVLSVTTGSASGGGSLSYDNTSGVFTFAPADLTTVQNKIVNGSSNVEIASNSGNITMAVSGTQMVDIGSTPNEISLTGNVTATANISATYVTATNSFNGNLIHVSKQTQGPLPDPQGFRVTQKYGVSDTTVLTSQLNGDGYALFGGNRLGATSYIAYSGTADLKFFEFEGSVTSGDANITVSAIRQGDDDSAATVSDLAVGYVLTGGTTIFDDDAYVTAIDSGTGNVTMSSTAVADATLTYSSGNTFSPGLVDTDTGLVMSLQSTLQSTGSGSYTTVATQNRRNIKYGYPQRGPSGSDFNVVAVGSNSEYSFADLSEFTIARTNMTPANTVIKANNGIVVGENTDLTNRGENDVFPSFGVNIMWDGLTDTGTEPIQPAMLFKSYMDNTAQSNAGNLGSGAPRMFFTTANGKSTDNAFDSYPRLNQELGRLTFWGSTGELLNPSSYNVPAYMSVGAANNWDTWGGGVGGNTNVYFGATGNGVTADTYLSYKEGEVFIGSNSTNKKPITFLPAAQVTGTRPQEAYIGGDTRWAEINYADTSAPSGAKFTINNGGSVDAGTVGDMQMSLKRLDNSSNLTTDIESILDGTVLGLSNQPLVMLDSALSPGNTLDGIVATMSASGTFTTSSSGNESALGGNQYTLNYVFTSGSTGNHGYRLSTGGAAPISGGGSGTVVTYTTLGGSSPYINAGDFNTIQTTPSTVTTVVSSGVTAKEWKFNLAEQSNNLALQSEAVTKVEFSDDASIFSNRVRFQNLDTTAINALTGMAAGDTVYNTTESTLCFYNGSSWQKVTHSAL